MAPSPPLAGVDQEQRRRLDSWKEIAAHLNRTVRTVQRWERDERLPVRRLDHQKQATVYAYVDELDAWWQQRSGAVAADERGTQPANVIAAATAEQTPVSPARAWSTWGVALGLVVLLLVGVVATSSSLRKPNLPSRADTLYASGRAAWNLRTADGFRKAQALFEAALLADPQHARAHSGLADTYSLLWGFGLAEREAALPRARAEAMRALAIDPELSEAHASLSYVLWEENDHAGALAESVRAIDLDPNYPTARHWYALYLQATKRVEEAIVQASRAVELDPGSPILATDLSIMLRSAGRIDDAEAVLERARLGHPSFPDVYVQLATLKSAKGRDAEALPLLKRAIALGDRRPRMIALLGCLEARTGNTAGAIRALEQLRQRAGVEFIPGDAEAVLLAQTGDVDGAYREIEVAYAKRETWLMDLLSAPCFEPIRRDGRWQTLEAGILANGAWQVATNQR